MAARNPDITKINGVDVDKLFATIDAVKQSPHLAEFRFRVSNKWIDCGHNQSRIKEFYGAGQEDNFRTEPFVLDADEPPVLLGTDIGPNPVEYLLKALAACVTSSLVYHAAAKGIKINSIESKLEGDLDLRGFLGLDENVPKGYKSIRMKFKVDADIPDDKLEELLKIGPKYSPVFNTLTRGVPVDVTLDR